MSHSFHYLIMAEHSIFQKELLTRLKDTGLTIGQPKVVERRMLNGNRHSLYVFLTEKGKKQLKLVTEAFSGMEEEAFRGISETERELFMDLMLRVYENISSRKD